MSVGPNKMNPFPGLRPFNQEEDYLFFGREEQTIELLQRLGGNRFVAVVGTSGSGKSSLVRCGLLSELLGGKMLQAGASWEIAVTHPGGNPTALLAEALLEADLYDCEEENVRENLLATLSRSHFGLVEAVKQAGLGKGTNFLLVVDQFEEIFRFHEAGKSQQEVANEFVSILLEAVAQQEVPIYVVLTMRSDFIGECGQFEGLAERVNQGEFLIPRLTREQYKRVIEGPIKVARGQITPRLLQRLLNDLGQQADQLPCLQHALMRTWNIWSEKEDSDALDLDDYQAVGKMSQALSLHADEVYETLSDDPQRERCRGIFQALTVQETETRGIRRPQRLGALAEILAVHADQLIPIIDAFRQPGVTFLMPTSDVELTDDTIIDISHESLMRVWTRLRHWVDDEAQAAGIYRRLTESAALHEQGHAALYRGPDLGIALAWREAKRPNQAWAERYRHGFTQAMRFLDESQDAFLAEQQERERTRQRELQQAQKLAEAERERAEIQLRAARRLRGMVAGLAVVAAIALVASVAAFYAKRDAELARVGAERSKLAAVQNATAAKLNATDAKLKAKLANDSKAVALAAQAALKDKEFSSDMMLAQHAYDAGNVGAVSKRLLKHVPGPGEPDPREIEWYLWWNASHQESTIVNRGGNHVYSITVSPDGRLAADSHWHNTIRLREVANPQKVKSFQVTGANDLRCLRFSPDSAILAATDGIDKVHRFSTENAKSLGSVSAPTRLRGLSFSPTQHVIVSGGDNGHLYFWDTTSWERSDFLASTESLPIWSVAYSPDGDHLAVGTDSGRNSDYAALGADSPLVLWDAAAGSVQKTAAGHIGRISSVAWSSDGEYLASGSADETVRVWTKELSPVKTLSSLAWVSEVAFSPDGKYLAAGTGKDNAIRVWSTDSWKLVTTIKGHSKPISGITFDPQLGDLWSGSTDSTIKIWNIERSLRQPVAALDDEALRTMLTSTNQSVVATDGRTLFCSGRDSAIERYDLESQTALSPWSNGESFRQAAFSDDGGALAAVDEEGLLQVWPTDKEESIAEVQMPAEDVSTLHTLGVSRGGSIVAWTAGNPLRLVLVDTKTGNRQRMPVGVGNAEWKFMTISPDATRLSLKSGFNFRLLDISHVETEGTVGVVRTSLTNAPLANSFVFSSDGRIGAEPTFDSVIHLYDLESDQVTETLTGHSSQVYCAAFSHDGRRLLTGSEDGTVRLWDIVTGDSLNTLKGHGGPVSWVGFRNDESEIISISHADGTVRVWHASDREQLQQNPSYWEELALYDQQAGRPARALAAYDKAIELSPQNANLLQSRVELHRERMKNDAAVADSIRLIALGEANSQFVDRTITLARQTPLVTNSNDRNLTWRYTFEQPRDDWTEPDFDDATWKVGISPFGSYAGDATKWTGDDDIWLRREFDLTAPVSKPLSFEAHCDDDAEFYLNGIHAAEGHWVGFRNQMIASSPQATAALKPGRNALAIHCRDNGGGGAGIDADLFVDQGPQRWIDLLSEALDNDAANMYLLQARWQAHTEQGNAKLAADDAAALLPLMQESVAADLENPDIVWPTSAGLLTDVLVATYQSQASNDWQVLDVTDMKSAGGATLTRLEDGSVLASGKNPDSDSYTIVAETDLTNFTALRIEALIHPSLPRGGPGRDSRNDLGNFSINKLRISSAARTQHDATSPVIFEKAWADYSNHPPEFLLRGYWNTGGRGGQAHQAIFLMEPISHTEGVRLVFNMPFQPNENWPGQNLGRFRLSVAADKSTWRNTMLVNGLRDLPGEWSRLAAAYYLAGDTQALDRLLEHKPSAAIGIGDLHAAVGGWEQAIESYSRLVSSDTNDAKLLVKRGEAYEALEQWDNAQADWQRATDLQPEVLNETFDRLRMAGHWQAAAMIGVMLIQEQPEDRNLWLGTAPTLVLAGDESGYREFCDRMVKQFADTTNIQNAESTCKACLLMPNAVDPSLLPLKVLTEPLDQDTATALFRPWGWAARALAAYRRGDTNQISPYLQEVWKSQASPEASALTYSIAALDRHGRGDLDGAREALGQAMKMIDEQMPYANAGQLHDWMIPLVLAREAEDLLEDEEQ